MPAFRVSLRILVIGVLCLGILNLHGAAAALSHADHHCPSLTEPAHVSSGIASPSTCCSKSPCCPVLVDCAQVADIQPPRLRSPLKVGVKPFLLVRALSPPPKSSPFVA